MKLMNKRDKHEFLPGILEIEDEPISPLNRIIFWMVMLFIVIAILWSFIGKVDVVVTTQGKIIPEGEVKTIQPLNTGTISRIFVEVNDFVKKGDPLVEIDPSQIQQDIKSMKRNIQVAKLEIERIGALINNSDFRADTTAYDSQLIEMEESIYYSTKNTQDKQLEVKQSELKRLTEEANIIQNEQRKIEMQISATETRLSRLESIKAYIKKDDIEQAQLELYQANKDFESTHVKLSENSIAMKKVHEEIALLKEDYINKLQKEYSEKSKDLEYLVADYEKSLFLNQKQLILSPIVGYISQKLIHTIGGVVTPAEKLFIIVPNQSDLIVKVIAMNKDIGFINNGMSATIKVDTFEYQKFGTIKGTVDHVSKDSIEDEKLGLIYEVYIKPASFIFDRKPDINISTGMSVTAEINIGKRRLIELFIFPLIRYFDEGMSVR